MIRKLNNRISQFTNRQTNRAQSRLFQRRNRAINRALRFVEPLENRLVLSAVGGFTIESAVDALQQTASNESQFATVTNESSPTIEWESPAATAGTGFVGSAESYQLIGNETGIAAGVFSADGLTEPSFTPDQPLDDGDYRVFVRAEFADGSFGDWSFAFNFTIDSQFDPTSFQLTWIPTSFEQPNFNLPASIDVRQTELNVVLPANADYVVTTSTSATDAGSYLQETTLQPLIDFTSDNDKSDPLQLAESDSDPDAKDSDPSPVIERVNSEQEARPSNRHEGESNKDSRPVSPKIERVAEEPMKGKTAEVRRPGADGVTPGWMNFLELKDTTRILDAAFADVSQADLLATV